MNSRTLSRYNLRQLQLPTEYKLRLQQVKRRISAITGRVPSIETIIMCLIDEFLNLHGDGDGDAPTDARDHIYLRTPTSEREINDK